MSWSRRRFPARTLLVVDFVLVVVIVVIFVIVVAALGLIVRGADFLFFLVEVVLVVRDFELDRRVARDAQQGPAFRARQLIADVDVVFVDINWRITLGTNRGHAGSS